jgi:KDO2-lipid IV(A) lauroyltransferase
VPEAEITRLAQAHYAHLGRVDVEFLLFPWLSPARRAAMARVESIEAILRAHAQGKGVLVLTGHFGNLEVATVAGMASFPQYRGRFCFLRRPLHPRWLDALVTRRFRRAGFGVLPKTGALDAILERLAAGDVIVYNFDRHAGGGDGVQVEFSGTRPAPSAAWRSSPSRQAPRWFRRPVGGNRMGVTCCALRSPCR